MQVGWGGGGEGRNVFGELGIQVDPDPECHPPLSLQIITNALMLS